MWYTTGVTKIREVGRMGYFDNVSNEWVEDPNPYYHPEKMGLTKVAEIELGKESYQFDIRCVWYHAESGRFYTARDSGCSCPTPFEDFRTLESLQLLNMDELRAEILANITTGDTERDWDRKLTPAEAQEFLYRVGHWQANKHPAWEEW